MISSFALIPSGLWHQRQDRGHPLKKTVVLIPGPSWIANLFISKIQPVCIRIAQSICAIFVLSTTAQLGENRWNGFSGLSWVVVLVCSLKNCNYSGYNTSILEVVLHPPYSLRKEYGGWPSIYLISYKKCINFLGKIQNIFNSEKHDLLSIFSVYFSKWHTRE